MSDPINPAHYAGRTCADIGERLTANGYQILKYVWRLGKKDNILTELGKAQWYAESEFKLLLALDVKFPGMRTQPLLHDLADPDSFLRDRIDGQPLFTREIAFHLWAGYDAQGARQIANMIDAERNRYASA